jgi:hypothetical protein
MARTREILVSEAGEGVMMHPIESDAGGNLDEAREMLTDPATSIASPISLRMPVSSPIPASR